MNPSAHHPARTVDAVHRRLPTARTYPALPVALLAIALLAGCTGGGPAEPADRPEVADIATGPSEAAGDATDPAAGDIEPAPEPTEATVDAEAPPATDRQVVAIENVAIDPAAVSAARVDPTLQGAIDTSYHFTAAWLHGITTGDTALLTELSLPSCGYCAAIPVSIAAEPRTAADGFTTRMTGTLVAADEARTEYPYPVVTLGISVEATYTGEVDGIAVMNLLEPQRVLFHLALDRSEAGWGVHGIAHEDWPEEA